MEVEDFVSALSVAKLKLNNYLHKLDEAAAVIELFDIRYPMSQHETFKAIAARTGLQQKQVRKIFDELRIIASSQVATFGTFVVPKLVIIKLKQKQAKRSQQKNIEGLITMYRSVQVPAQPAKKVIKVFPAKALKNSISHLPCEMHSVKAQVKALRKRDEGVGGRAGQGGEGDAQQGHD